MATRKARTAPASRPRTAKVKTSKRAAAPQPPPVSASTSDALPTGPEQSTADRPQSGASESESDSGTDRQFLEDNADALEQLARDCRSIPIRQEASRSLQQEIMPSKKLPPATKPADRKDLPTGPFTRELKIRDQLPASAQAAKKKKWEDRWGVDSKPDEKARSEDLVEDLRAQFWGHANSEPRCYSCRKAQTTLSTKVTGLEDPELLPCGCQYELAMLEMYMVNKGTYDIPVIDDNDGSSGKTKKRKGKVVPRSKKNANAGDGDDGDQAGHDSQANQPQNVGKNVKRRKRAGEDQPDHVKDAWPKTFGKHRVLLYNFFEMQFGKFSFEKLLNIGDKRVKGCQRQARKESRTKEGQLREVSPYNPDEDTDEGPRKRRRR